MNADNEGIVRFTPFGENGIVLDPITISYDEYYGETNSPIDDSDWIRVNRINAITVEVYGLKGKLQSFAVNFYDGESRYANGKAVHADGTVTG